VGLDQVINFCNIMAYDVGPEYMPNNQTWTLHAYDDLLRTFVDAGVPLTTMVMGFEPGGQAAGGVWEGFEVDRQMIRRAVEVNLGGVMFWAINQPPMGTPDVTGLNADVLARYAQSQFPN
jgi:hypothetical protein